MLRSRLETWALSRIARHYNRKLGPRKTALLRGLQGDVLEIGSGTGANLEFLPSAVTWTGADPNPYSHVHALRAAALLGVRSSHCCAAAERLPFADGRFDAVLSTLTICSVREPERALAEVRRVLKPGGLFVFLEHVAARDGSPHRKVQQRAAPFFRCCLRCNPLLETERLIRQAGFLQGEIERFEADLPVVRPHIAGAVRR